MFQPYFNLRIQNTNQKRYKADNFSMESKRNMTCFIYIYIYIYIYILLTVNPNTVCSTRYLTRHFFNNCNTSEVIATKFEQEYVRCVRNEEKCVCSSLQISLHYPH